MRMRSTTCTGRSVGRAEWWWSSLENSRPLRPRLRHAQPVQSHHDNNGGAMACGAHGVSIAIWRSDPLMVTERVLAAPFAIACATPAFIG